MQFCGNNNTKNKLHYLVERRNFYSTAQNHIIYIFQLLNAFTNFYNLIPNEILLKYHESLN